MYSLLFKWGTSRGRDSYGWNICSLWVNGVKVSSCKGGGYDMKGTAFAEWIETAFQSELLALGSRANAFYRCAADGRFIERFENGAGPADWIGRDRADQFYGMSAYCHRDGTAWQVKRVHLDGACGLESIRLIFKALGYGLQYVSEAGRNSSYIAAPSDTVDALHGPYG